MIANFDLYMVTEPSERLDKRIPVAAHAAMTSFLMPYFLEPADLEPDMASRTYNEVMWNLAWERFEAFRAYHELADSPDQERALIYSALKTVVQTLQIPYQFNNSLTT